MLLLLQFSCQMTAKTIFSLRSITYLSVYVGFGSRGDQDCLSQAVAATAAAARSGGKREEKESVWKLCDWLTTPWLAALLSSSIVRLWAHWQHCHTFPITASQSQLRRARAPTCCCWWQFSLQAKPDCLSVCTQRILHTLREKARYRGKLENDRGISLSRTWGLSQEWQKCREWSFLFFLAGASPSNSKQPSLKGTIFDSFTRRMHALHTHTHTFLSVRGISSMKGRTPLKQHHQRFSKFPSVVLGTVTVSHLNAS